jgi:hypothetical protein
MLAIVASCVLALAALTVTASFLSRRVRVAQAQIAALRHEVEQLTALAATASQEAERLAAAFVSSRVQSPVGQAHDRLAQLAALGDPAATQSDAALSAAAAKLAEVVPGVPVNLFDDNRREESIVRLHERGHAPAEIARRLSVPVGEVELRLSMRAR